MPKFIYIDSAPLVASQTPTGNVVCVQLLERAGRQLYICAKHDTPMYIAASWQRGEPMLADRFNPARLHESVEMYAGSVPAQRDNDPEPEAFISGGGEAFISGGGGDFAGGGATTDW